MTDGRNGSPRTHRVTGVNAVHSRTPHRWPARALSGRHEEQLLFRRYRTTRDAATREQIVTRYLGLATSVATRFSRTSVSHDDRVQLARVGLLKAIERFDPDHGTAFSSFAVPTMVGELQRHLRDHTWAVRPPRDLQDRVLRVDREAEQLGRTLGRAPTSGELARATGLSVEEVLETLEAGHARGATSLDQSAGPDHDDPLGSILGGEDAQYGRVEQAVVVDDLLSELSPRAQQILRLRFQHDLTQSEIGSLVGCSQMHVSRIMRAALDQLGASAAAERTELLAAL